MSDPYKDIEEKARTEPSDAAKYWGKELELARKRQSRYRKHAAEVVKIYEGEIAGENSFNILYSNTETLLPAIYNQLPRPDVGRTFPDDTDPIANAGAKVLQRTIQNIADAQNAEYDQAHRLFQQAVLGGLVPGQGVTRWFYDAEIKTSQESVVDEDGGAPQGVDEEALDGDKDPFVPERTKSRVTYESICGKDLDYDQILYGYARRWVDVPWVGFEHFMLFDDLVANFGEEVAREIKLAPYTKPDSSDWKGKGDEADEGEHNHGSQPGAYVVEIWNKAKKEVCFYCETYDQKLVGKPKDDPFGLSGFYPICEPLKFQMKTSGIIPKPIYKLYEAQAKELNRLSMRINKILNAMKVRGFYDGSLGDLKSLLEKADNVLLPAANASAFYEGKNLANAIWLMPLNELVTVLQQLIMGREQCKNTIYEITGISDIMRGDTQASETYGAQKLKSKWGTSRLQKFQGEVQRYCRDCYRIIAELAAKNFSPETFAKVTNLPYATDKQVAQAQQTMQQGQRMMAMMQQQMPPPAPGPDGQPQQPPPPPQMQQVQQQMQQAQQVLQNVHWKDVLEMIESDVDREYRIDIETNSTIDPTRQEDKQDIIDVMTALANTVESFGPLVEQRVFPMPAFKSMLKSIVSRFTFGKQVEDSIDAIPDDVPNTPNNSPQAQSGGSAPPSPEEMQADQLEAQNRIQIAQAQAQVIPLKMQLEQQQLQNDIAKAQRDRETADHEHQLNIATIRAKIMAAGISTQQKQAQATIQTQAAHAGAQIKTRQAADQAMISGQAARDSAAISKQSALDGAAIAKQKGQDANKLARQRGNGQQKR